MLEGKNSYVNDRSLGTQELRQGSEESQTWASGSFATNTGGAVARDEEIGSWLWT